LEKFEKMMTNHISNWAKSIELQELLTMATPQENSGNSKLEYMQLQGFAEAKRDKLYLKNYSKLDNIVAVTLHSISTKSLGGSQNSTVKDDATKAPKPKPTNETWQERMIRMAKINPATLIHSILNDLNNKPAAYIGHEKDVAKALMEQMKRKSQWQEEPPKEGKHDNYKLTQKVKKYL
jgi:hypothetical protein